MFRMSNRKVLLMILDGWGIGDGQKGDVIAQVHPAYISEMTRKYPHAQLRTDGENVGLPDGQMGNSEVGHLNIAAGPVDLHQILVYDASGADIQVTYFRITHLSVGKADVFAVGQQLRRRIFGLQAVDIDRVGRINHIVVAVIAFAPAVQNHQ